MIETPSVSREEYERNQKRSGHAVQVCYICGSSCKNPTLWIHVVHGGRYALLAEEAAPEWIYSHWDLGLQPVGASCLKRFPELKEYIQRIPLVTARRKK